MVWDFDAWFLFFGGNVEVSELILGIRGKMCERTCIPIVFSCCFFHVSWKIFNLLLSFGSAVS